ncbi:MAG: sodium:solute symporter [Bacteroidetes bacterium]|nr:sodium:solute symporter [Bacteroidota bacterium]
MSPDWLILFAYLALSVTAGLAAGRGLTTVTDYFSGERKLPVWAVTISIVATETSALTFLSIPGLAIAGNFSFLQVALGYIIGRLIISVWLIPRYASGDLFSVYQWIGARFGGQAQRSLSGVFMVTRLLADGVRLYATAIPVVLLMHQTGLIPVAGTGAYVLVLSILGVITILYTVFGGIRAVIWTDVIQWVVYLSGGILALISVWWLLPAGEAPSHPMVFFNLTSGSGSWLDFTEPYLALNAILGGILLSMASHGTDQIIVQRVLCTPSVRDARMAMSLSGILVFFQFILFLSIGYLLGVFYQDTPLRPDEVFSRFIVTQLPTGFAGLIIAAVIAAAMSTISSSINALAASTLSDWKLIPITHDNGLSRSRWVSVGWGVVLTLVSILLVAGGGIFKEKVVETGLAIASVTYGPVLGVFLLGLTGKTPRWPVLLGSLVLSLVSMVFLVFFTPVAWTWFTASGLVLFTFFCGLLTRFTYE